MDTSPASAPQLFARAADSTDGPERSLSGGAVAGIVIGIVVVFALLAALLGWRMYTYKTNRDFYSGQFNRPFPSQRRRRDHVRSTRQQLAGDEHHDSVIDMHAGNEDEKYLTSGDAAPAHSHINLGEQGEYNGESSYLQSHETRYPSETNRASWWWRPQRAASPEEVQAEIMQSDHSHRQTHQGPSSIVGNVNDAYDDDDDPHAYQPDPIAAHPAVLEAERTTTQHEQPTKSQRGSFRQGCTTQ